MFCRDDRQAIVGFLSFHKNSFLFFIYFSLFMKICTDKNCKKAVPARKDVGWLVEGVRRDTHGFPGCGILKKRAQPERSRCLKEGKRPRCDLNAYLRICNPPHCPLCDKVVSQDGGGFEPPGGMVGSEGMMPCKPPT